ncbi:MAG: succinyldiaminopimelate transaminase [Burkholderiaceae bacterium]|nr:succinyldiaminopimelate transaminase [Burkholderiaceae bacterium]
MLNQKLNLLHPYPFERLAKLQANIEPNSSYSPINLSIGEPRHPTPAVLTEAMCANVAGLASYPATAGSPELRRAIAAWIERRYAVAIDPASEVLPVNGSREALFAFAQVVIDPAEGGHVVCPNPFYQIYEGAALLAGATPWYLPQTPEQGYRCDWQSVPEEVWARTRLVYLCTPGNPTGVVASLEEWRNLFALSDRHGFVIASDECYSEIYFDEAAPPLGALQAARALGRGFDRVVAFSSLSKRSNAPGLRSGFVAGDPALLERFLHYRTYHGSAMSPVVQAASIAAWGDEAHVRANRRLYREKFDAVTPILAKALEVSRPEAGFYLWARVPGGDDIGFGLGLLRQYNVRVLPGSLLARDWEGENPGTGFLRIALVDNPANCVEAAGRIVQFASGA